MMLELLIYESEIQPPSNGTLSSPYAKALLFLFVIRCARNLQLGNELLQLADIEIYIIEKENQICGWYPTSSESQCI